MLPVVVGEAFLAALFEAIGRDPATEVEVNLPEQLISHPASGRSEPFEINAYKKHCLINGLDDLDFLLASKPAIEAYERRRQ